MNNSKRCVRRDFILHLAILDVHFSAVGLQATAICASHKQRITNVQWNWYSALLAPTNHNPGHLRLSKLFSQIIGSEEKHFNALRNRWASGCTRSGPSGCQSDWIFCSQRWRYWRMVEAAQGEIKHFYNESLNPTKRRPSLECASLADWASSKKLISNGSKKIEVQDAFVRRKLWCSSDHPLRAKARILVVQLVEVHVTKGVSVRNKWFRRILEFPMPCYKNGPQAALHVVGRRCVTVTMGQVRQHGCMSR